MFRTCLVGLIVFLVLGGPLPAEAQSALFLDLRLLIAAHPLFRYFDSTSHRFRSTSSEPILGGAQGLAAFKDQIDRLVEELSAFPKTLQRRLEAAPAADRIAAEARALDEKKRQEALLEVMKERLYYATLLPGRPGWTPNHAIFPSIRALLRDIQGVIRTLQNHYRAPVILDISAIYPFPPKEAGLSRLLLQNCHFRFWRGDFSDPQSLPWIQEAKAFWSRFDDGALVVPTGGRDVRLESVQLLERIYGGRK